MVEQVKRGTQALSPIQFSSLEKEQKNTKHIRNMTSLYKS